MVSTRRGDVPFRIWHLCFKLCQIPFLPFLCWNVFFSTEEFYCATFPSVVRTLGDKNQRWPHGGICPARHLDAHCDSGITSLFDVTSHCVGAFFCVSGQKREKREKKTFQMPLPVAFYNASGGQLCSNVAIVVVLEKLPKRIPTSCN